MSTLEPDAAVMVAPQAPKCRFKSMHDIRCSVTAVLGTGTVTVRECLELGPNSVVTLRQHAGQDLELHVNGVLVAYGEVVIVEDKTSLRVSRIALVNEAGG